MSSTMSVISSTFMDFGENGGMEDEYGEYEPPEMKFTPVKIEVPDDDTGNATEEYIVDNFAQQFVQDDGSEENVALKEETDTTTSQVRSSKRVRKSQLNVRLGIQKEGDSFDELELEQRESDKEWSPEDDVWAPEGQKRKSRSTASKRSVAANRSGKGGGARRKRQSSKERKRKTKERIFKLRAKRREQNAAESCMDNKTEVKSEIEDSEEGSRSSSRGKGARKRSEKAKEAMATKRQQMTPEQREAEKRKNRERARIKRAQLRNANDPEALKKLEEQRARAREQARLRRALLRETESKKLEEQRAKAREKMRIKRATLREAASEEAERKLEEMREKSRERMRQIRELAKQKALPEDKLRSIEIQKEKDRERKRAKRAAMTPEEKKLEFQKNYFYRISKRSRLPEDEQRALKIKEYMQKQAKLAEETPEEREQRLKKVREKGKQYYHKRKLTMDREKMRERQRQWWHKMDPEKKNRYKERYREMYRRRIQTLKEDPEKWKEMRKLWTEQHKMCRQQRREMISARRRRRKDNPEDEKVVRNCYKKKWSDLSNEEREKLYERRRETQLKRKLAIQKLLDSGMTMEQIKQQTETPEQRERRCIQQRIRKARRALRARLQNLGLKPEEIKQREEELKRTYKPVRKFRPYKPRFESWKPIDPDEVSKLAAEGKLDDLAKVDPLTLLPKPRSTKLQASASPKSTEAATQPTSTAVNVACPDSPRKRRGRSPKSSASEQQAVKTEVKTVALQPTTVTPNLQQQSSSFSVATLQPCPTLNYPQPQFQGRSSTSYDHPPPSVSSISSPVFLYPHQQPQQLVQPYTLQNILDGITLHHPESSTGFVQPSSESQQHQESAQNQYETSASNSQHEYENRNYYTDHDDTYSPSASPTDRDKGLVYNDPSIIMNSDLKPTKQLHSFTMINLTPPTTNPTVKEKTDAKPKKKKQQRPYRYRPSTNPNAKLRGSRILNADKRTIFCDQCPQSFTLESSLDAHKKQLHNPNYDIQNRLCRICGETFKHAQVWFSHYHNTHVKPKDLAEKPKPFVCDLCGSGFMSLNYLNKHQYYQHGDGQKVENHQQCPVCQKIIKATGGYNEHLLKYHPEHDLGTHECYRCEKTFSSAGKLREHVKEGHPDSYFPCPDCHAVRFTELGLFGHIRHGRCSAKNTEKKKKLKEAFSMDKLMVACELCSKKVVLGSLGVHYRTMHRAHEELFKCSVCQKKFKNREFWAIHLEEKHQIKLEEIKDIVRMLNLSNREGISVKPLSRPRGKKLVRGLNKKSHKKGRSKRRNSSDDDEDNSESDADFTSDLVVEKAKSMLEKSLRKVRKKRRVKVIAEEDDEMESQASQSGAGLE